MKTRLWLAVVLLFSGAFRVSGQVLPSLSANMDQVQRIRAQVIRVDFADAPGCSLTPAAAVHEFNKPAGVKDALFQWSYGKVIVEISESDVTPVLRMPKRSREYTQYDFDLPNHARAVAGQAGIGGSYNLSVVFSDGAEFNAMLMPWSTYFQGYNAAELLRQYFEIRFIPPAIGQLPFSDKFSGTDPYDLLGSGTTANHDINPFMKNFLGWMPASAIVQISTAGVYRVYRHDHVKALSRPESAPLVLKIPRRADYEYWISYRQNELPGLDVNGAYVISGRGTWSFSGMVHPHQCGYLDLNPSLSNPADGVLRVGDVFRDEESDISFRVLGQGGEEPYQYLEIEISVPERTGLSEALDSEFSFTSQGSTERAKWHGAKGLSSDGIDAARSGLVERGEQSSIAGRIFTSGRATVGFSWKVSSVPLNGRLAFLMDGVQLDEITGKTGWEPRIFPISEGAHDLEWRYTEGPETSGAAGCGWVDQLKFHAVNRQTEQTITFEPVAQPAGPGIPVVLAASASSDLPVRFSVVSGPALVVGNIAMPTDAGHVTIRAMQGGDASFLSAPEVERSFQVAAPASRVLGADVPDWDVPVGGPEIYPRQVDAMAFQDDGKLVIGGYFSTVAGQPRGNLARFNSDGTLDPTWMPNVDFRGVRCMAIAGDSLYVAGQFFAVNNVPRTTVAKISLSDNGSLQSEWDPGINNVGARAIAPGPGGSVIIGGNIAGGGTIFSPSQYFLVKCSRAGAGAVDTNWRPSAESQVLAMFVDASSACVYNMARRVAKFSLAAPGVLEAEWLPEPGSSGAFGGRPNLVGTADALYNVDAGALLRVRRADNEVARLRNVPGEVTALQPAGEHVYVSSLATRGPAVTNFTLRRVTKEFAFDSDWSAAVLNEPRTDLYNSSGIHSMTARGRDLFLCGDFISVGGAATRGIAMIPELESAPKVTGATTTLDRQTTEGLVIAPGEKDLIETSHFQIGAIRHGTLFKADGTNRVVEGAFVSRTEARAGLRFTPAPGFTGEASFSVRPSLRAHSLGVGGPAAVALIQVRDHRLEQQIDLPLPTTLVFGSAPLKIAGTASSGLPVRLEVLSGPAFISSNGIEILGTGSVRIRAVQEGDASFLPAETERSIEVAKAIQTISFPPPDSASSPIVLQASSTSGLPVSFELMSGTARLVSNVLSELGEGSVIVRAIQPGDANFEAAPPVERTFVFGRQPQTIHFTPLPRLSYGMAAVPLSASASSGLPVQFAVLSGPASIQERKLHLSGAGLVNLKVFQPGDATHRPAPSIFEWAIVYKGEQSIDFDLPESVFVGSGEVPLIATATSELPVRFSIVAGPGAISEASQLAILGVGKIAIQAAQSGNEFFLPAAPVLRTIRAVTPRILSRLQSSSLALSWTGPANAVLQRSDNLNGPWKEERATNEFVVEFGTNVQQFFRLKVAP